jgi:hypothetical protein
VAALRVIYAAFADLANFATGGAALLIVEDDPAA